MSNKASPLGEDLNTASAQTPASGASLPSASPPPAFAPASDGPSGPSGHPTITKTVSFRLGDDYILPVKATPSSEGDALLETKVRLRHGVDYTFPSDLEPSSEGVASELAHANNNPPPVHSASTLLPVSEGVGTSSDHLKMPEFVNPDTVGLRRSSRHSKPRIITCLFLLFGFMTAANGFSTVSQGTSFAAKSLVYASDLSRNVDGTINFINPVSQVFASLQDNDTYTYREAMQQSDRRDFVVAMYKEIMDHHNRDHWKIVNRHSVGNPKTILAIWSFKRKRLPNGVISKHKARLCAHGGIQQWGVNYWETLSPVVNWMSV